MKLNLPLLRKLLLGSFLTCLILFPAIFLIHRGTFAQSSCAGPADVNCDEQVNVLDLRAILAVWFQQGTPPDYREDIVNDHRVNAADAVYVIANWLSVPTATPTRPPTPQCGDGFCDGPSTETCGNCQVDCGPCNLRNYNRTVCHSSNLQGISAPIPIDNPWLPMPIGMRNILSNRTVTVEIIVTNQVEIVDGIPTRVVEERECGGNNLPNCDNPNTRIECSYNYFVQIPQGRPGAGTVCYYGENVTNCKGSPLGGSWRAGEGSGCWAGIMMPTSPTIGQEWIIEDASACNAWEDAVVNRIIPSYTTLGNYTFNNAMYVREDGGASNKTYALNYGMVGDEDMSLINTTFPTPTP